MALDDLLIHNFSGDAGFHQGPGQAMGGLDASPSRTTTDSWSQNQQPGSDLDLQRSQEAVSLNELLRQHDLTGGSIDSLILQDASYASLAGISPSLLADQPRFGPIRTLMVIDQSMADWRNLVLHAPFDAELLLLDRHSDGVKQISDFLGQQQLTGSRPFDTVAIVSEGSKAKLQLGNGLLESSNLAGYADELRSWGGALKANADILIFGCNVGAGSEGAGFVRQLAELTGADIAASNDLSGGREPGEEMLVEAGDVAIEADISGWGLALSPYLQEPPDSGQLMQGDPSIELDEGNQQNWQLDDGGAAVEIGAMTTEDILPNFGDTTSEITQDIPIVDQEQTNFDIDFPYNGYQSFTAGLTGRLTSIELAQHGGTLNPQQVELAIYNGNDILGSALGIATTSETNDFNWLLGGFIQTYIFSDPISIVSGNVYVFKVTSDSDVGLFGLGSAEGYSDGDFYHSDGRSGDLWFRTKVLPEQSLPPVEPEQSLPPVELVAVGNRPPTYITSPNYINSETYTPDSTDQTAVIPNPDGASFTDQTPVELPPPLGLYPDGASFDAPNSNFTATDTLAPEARNGELNSSDSSPSRATTNGSIPGDRNVSNSNSTFIFSQVSGFSDIDSSALNGVGKGDAQAQKGNSTTMNAIEPPKGNRETINLVEGLKQASQDDLRSWFKRFGLFQTSESMDGVNDNSLQNSKFLPQSINRQLGFDSEISNGLLNALIFGGASLYIINKTNPGLLKQWADSLWGSQTKQKQNGNHANRVIAVFLMRSTTALDRLVAVELHDDAIEILAEEKLLFSLDTAAQRHHASFDNQLKKLCLKLENIGLPTHELLLLDPELQSALSIVEHLGQETKIMKPNRLCDVVEQLSTTELNQLQVWLSKPGSNPLDSHPIKSNLEKRQNELEHQLSREKANVASLIELSLAMGLRQPAISLV